MVEIRKLDKTPVLWVGVQHSINYANGSSIITAKQIVTTGTLKKN